MKVNMVTIKDRGSRDKNAFEAAMLTANKIVRGKMALPCTLLQMDMSGSDNSCAIVQQPIGWSNEEEKVRQIVMFHANTEVLRERILAHALEENTAPNDIPVYYGMVAPGWQSKAKEDIAPSKDPDRIECLTVQVFHITGYCVGGCVYDIVRSPRGKVKDLANQLLIPADVACNGIFTLRDHNRTYKGLWLSEYDDEIESGKKRVWEWLGASSNNDAVVH